MSRLSTPGSAHHRSSPRFFLRKTENLFVASYVLRWPHFIFHSSAIVTTLDNTFRNPLGIIVVLVVLATLMGLARVSSADEIQGFMEPIRSIELASAETGIIKSVNVSEGQKVKKDQVLARLDDEIQKIQLDLAKHLANSKSAAEAARKALDKREMITERIRKLRNSGNASESELIRSEMELAIAKAKYMAAIEELKSREIEKRRAEITLRRRTIRAPFNGVVAKLHYHQGEFLSPIKPELLQLVQVDELLAVFPVPVSLAPTLKNKKHISVYLSDGTKLHGSIHSLGVTADASSNTLSLKVKINNASGKLHSGEECYLRF